MAKVRFELPWTVAIFGQPPKTMFDEKAVEALCRQHKIPKPRRQRMHIPALAQFGLRDADGGIITGVDGVLETDRADVIEFLSTKVGGLRFSQVEVEKFKASPEAKIPPPPPVEVQPDLETMSKKELIDHAGKHNIYLDHRLDKEKMIAKLRSELAKVAK